MNAIDYGTLAQEWLEHVVQQYDMTHVCSKDLRLIEHFLKEGFTLVAFRDDTKVLRVDFVFVVSGVLIVVGLMLVPVLRLAFVVRVPVSFVRVRAVF